MYGLPKPAVHLLKPSIRNVSSRTAGKEGETAPPLSCADNGSFRICSVEIHIGSTEIPIKEVFEICMDQFFYGGEGLKAGKWSVPHFQIVWNIRLPRVLVRFFFAEQVFLSAEAMQALVLNPVGDPYILGISSGASAGAAKRAGGAPFPV